MPLSKLQTEIFRILAARRDPESHIPDSTWLTRQGPRISADIDIFHDREERVARAAEDDVAAIRAAGMKAEWQRREPLFYHGLVIGGGDRTNLEWVVDSDFRFFPAQRDSDVGYVLHPADLATYKIMAAAVRRHSGGSLESSWTTKSSGTSSIVSSDARPHCTGWYAPCSSANGANRSVIPSTVSAPPRNSTPSGAICAAIASSARFLVG